MTRPNGKITAADLRLAKAVRHLTPPGGSATAADVAARLHQPQHQVLRDADRAQAHGVAYRYTYQGETRIGLSDAGWEIRGGER